jgi:hypothetical protein
MKEKWIILQSTLCQGTIPAWFGDDDKPVVWDTEEEAQAELLSEHINTLERHFKEFKNGDREFDEIEIDCQDWIEPCTVDDEGVITLEYGVVYDPKTYVR